MSVLIRHSALIHALLHPHNIPHTVEPNRTRPLTIKLLLRADNLRANPRSRNPSRSNDGLLDAVCLHRFKVPCPGHVVDAGFDCVVSCPAGDARVAAI